MSGISLLSSLYEKPKRPRVFISYHHGGDQTYYDEFSRHFHDRYEAIYDNSLERQIDSDNADYVMRRIRENYITGSSCTIVMVGAQTYLRKYVDWEIKATLDAQHGLIGIRLPTAPTDAQGKVTVPGRLYDNIQSGYALWTSWSDIAKGAVDMNGLIEQANSRNKNLINNTRDKKLRNG